ncbi:MAG: TIGR04053 family radical SAM/SPASM domain-containing protein [Ardenticatenia bacterium]|nr:TIGR04053 family radical SAM/SPASM domain-containing protein [Ardenticatenia bacterium]
MPEHRFANAPLLVYWEVTRACDLACRHCRAEAMPARHPDELTTDEGFRLLDALTAFRPQPHIVFTGGDPLKRPDLFAWIERAVALGFRTAITPSGTYALTREVVHRFKAAGVWMMAVSVDGSTAERHDAIRQVPGSFDQTMRAICWAQEINLPIQVNTLVCAETYDDVPAVGRLLVELGVSRWSVFFLVPTGRGRVLGDISPHQAETLLTWLYTFSRTAPFDIKTTEAHHYRRIALQQSDRQDPAQRERLAVVRRGFTIRDGAGIMFISHVGEIYPAGFLPVPVGNVRTHDPVAVYRADPLFVALRDPDRFRGKCGLCEYRIVCGGSRARAYALTGDPLESDPLCLYQPPAWPERSAVA